jgi:putative ABC transport system ATP-binding protein
MSLATTSSTVIELRGVRKIYRMGDEDVHALRGVDLVIPKGGYVAIMGASGSGKSTMLNLLGCLDRPTAGEYLLDGEDVAQLDDDALSLIRLRHIGFVFQSFHLIPQLTVIENIELPLSYAGLEDGPARERALVYAKRVGLEQRIGHRPQQLSGGQQQRVAIARALAGEPDLLLADEPTGNLDSATGNEIMALLDDLNGQGVTIILVTHEEDIAAHAKTRIYMSDGLIARIEGEALDT